MNREQRSTLEADRKTAPLAEMIPVIRAAIEKGKPVEMTVTGNSMLPLLKDRVSSVRLTKPEVLEKGDIVLYCRRDGHYVLHRIVGVHNDVYDIVGDNQRAVDRNVHRENILARVSAYSRDGRKWKEDDSLYRRTLPALKAFRRYGTGAKRKLGTIIKRT